MEKEIRQDEIRQVIDAVKRQGVLWELQDDFTRFRSLQLLWLDGLDELQRLGNSRLEFRNRRLGILVFRDWYTGQASGGAFGGVAGDLDLVRQRQHVDDKARLRK